MLSTRSTPQRWKAASRTASLPVRAPVWEAAAWRLRRCGPFGPGGRCGTSRRSGPGRVFGGFAASCEAQAHGQRVNAGCDGQTDQWPAACDVAAHPLGVVLVGGALRGALRLFLNQHGAGEGPRFPLVSEVGEVSGPHGVADTDAVAGLHARGLALLQVLGG